MRRKKFAQKIVNYAFTLILTVLFIILFLSLDLYYGIFDSRSILRNMNESRYYNEIYTKLNKEAEYIVLKAGLPSEVLENVISRERTHIGGRQYVEAVLRGDTPEISADKLHEELMQNINDYLEKENIHKTEGLTAGLDSLASDVEQLYIQGMQFEFIPLITEYRQKYMSVMVWIIPIVLVSAGLICYFLLRMHSFKHRGLRSIDYAVNASSVLVIGAAVYLLAAKKYVITSAEPEYYRSFLSQLMEWDFKVLLYLGCMGIAISLILITLIGYMKNRINS